MTHTYDALNRLTQSFYPSGTLNVRYDYDQSNAVTGCAVSYSADHLTQMTDVSGIATYCYDRRGNLTRKSQNSNGEERSVAYTFDLADRLSTVTYPSGGIATYTRDNAGRILSVTWKSSAAANPVSVVSNVRYYPFGPLNALTFGNGRVLTKTYDNNYLIDSVSSSIASGLQLDLSTNVLGNIVDARSPLAAATPTRTYTYDNLYRLTDVRDGGNALLEHYAYNATGDRTQKQLAGQAAQSYTYASGAHRLDSVAGVARQYDENGNTTAPGDGSSLTYDERNRLARVSLPPPQGLSSRLSPISNVNYYSYNGTGERVGSGHSLSGLSTTWIYDEAGHVIGSYTGFGSSGGTELVYLDNLPVAQITAGAISYLETDHLGTPRVAVNPATNATQWSWDFYASAFGEHAAVSAASGGINVSLRYPGQWFDGATHYNIFRDYEPGTGRYLESDPIGLDGGVATYSYVGNSPLLRTDPTGEDWRTGFAAGCAIGGAVGNTIGTGGGAAGGAVLCSPTGPGAAGCAIGGGALGGWALGGIGCGLGGAIGAGIGAMCSESPADREKRCEEGLARDLATCAAIGKRFGKKTFAICEQQAMLRYGNCLSGRDEGIDAPLPPWGKL